MSAVATSEPLNSMHQHCENVIDTAASEEESSETDSRMTTLIQSQEQQTLLLQQENNNSNSNRISEDRIRTEEASDPKMVRTQSSSLSSYFSINSKAAQTQRHRPKDGESLRHDRELKQLIRGGLLGALVAAMLLLILAHWYPSPLSSFNATLDNININSVNDEEQNQNVRGRSPLSSGIAQYLNLFQYSMSTDDDDDDDDEDNLYLKEEEEESSEDDHTSKRHRKLMTTTESHSGPQLVIAGKMSVEDSICNIAQYNLKDKEWSLRERIQLSLYNSYSGGEVYSLLANHTQQINPTLDSTTARSPNFRKSFEGGGELIVVGAFDTTYRNSQVTYCSVGRWDGVMLSKVGEGLCNSALSKGMKITTAALAGPQDVYVAGSFQTQVWNGERHEFVKIYNIAHYNAVDQVWLPLNIGQITCSWCTVTVLALAWDSKRRQLHVTGKFNAIDGQNIPAGLAIYDLDSGHLVAHPGGGLSMQNKTQDGVGTALQLDEESGVLYVMGSFERLTASDTICSGLAAYEINTNRWTCLADPAHTVLPTGGGNMLLTPYGLMVAGKTASNTTWPDSDRPYTIALLKATLRTHKVKDLDDDYYDDDSSDKEQQYHEFDWSWLPGFKGHDEPLHALSNGFGSYAGTVFIAGDNLVAKWSYEPGSGFDGDSKYRRQLSTSSSSSSEPQRLRAVSEILSGDNVRGSIMAISQMIPESDEGGDSLPDDFNITIIVYGVIAGCMLGMFGAYMCNRNRVFPMLGSNSQLKGISLDTLTYGAINADMAESYKRAMRTRYVQQPHLLTIIDPQQIFLQKIIGEGTFGRVWSARWRSASVAVKEFVFAQAAVAGKSAMQQEIVEEIIGEAGMMAILRHPNVLQLFGCSLTAQAIWIVSELCSLGSLRQVLDDSETPLPLEIRVSLALQVAEGMTYLHNQESPIIHRDLKSHNIFVHETYTDMEETSSTAVDDMDLNGPYRRVFQPEKMNTHSTLIAKIGDWGSARATLSGSRTMTHGVGTACWLAPEVIKHARSSKYSDVYGYGIVLWELATREEVYQGLETTQIIAKVANESLRPPVPQNCPWKDVMVQCWEERPQDRPEFIDIVGQLDALSQQMDKEEKFRVVMEESSTSGFSDLTKTNSDPQDPRPT